jgi:holo-[acyl-carrier protein] synthase
MIIGIGIDIFKVERIEKVLAKSYSQNFKKKVFTQNEIDYCEKYKNPAQNFAVRWAIKEAFYKALPEDLQEISSWKSIEFINKNGKKPFVQIVSEKLIKGFNDFGISKIHASVSHEKEFCVAQVILEG